MSLTERLLAGDLRALARLATHVENDDPTGRAALSRLYARSGRAHVVGVTGPPGAGKSSLVNALIGVFRDRGRRVGVVAVDPTSPLTGGAALGDRIRMMDRHADEGVFIRSMASRGNPGGLALASMGVVHLLDAAGFDPIFMETVGVGQDEVEIARRAQTTVLLQVPGLGDGVQAIKAGILEVADVLAVSKADRPGAAELARDLRQLAVGHSGSGWRAPVVLASPITGEGITDLVDQIVAHRAYLEASGELARRLRDAAAAEVAGLLREELERRREEAAAFARLVEMVAERRRAPHEAVAELLGRIS